jgi:uncharacterized protein YndB with AHSA1/START domain
MKRNLAFERDYPYPLDAVWDALTDPAALADWLMDNDFQPFVGHRFQFRTQPNWGFDGIIYCEVLAVEKPTRLVYSWQGGPMKQPTTVTWLLEAIPNGTRLRLRHEGFEGAAGILLSLLLGSGWGGLLRERLLALLKAKATPRQGTDHAALN